MYLVSLSLSRALIEMVSAQRSDPTSARKKTVHDRHRDGRERGEKGRKVEGVALPRLNGELSHMHSRPDTPVEVSYSQLVYSHGDKYMP